MMMEPKDVVKELKMLEKKTKALCDEVEKAELDETNSTLQVMTAVSMMKQMMIVGDYYEVPISELMKGQMKQ